MGDEENPDLDQPATTDAGFASSGERGKEDEAFDPHRAGGYAKMAQLMGDFPELAIVRRFGTLNTLNILYLQAELVHLEQQLRYFAEKDFNSTDLQRKMYCRDWFLLARGKAGVPTADRTDAQWQTMLSIRRVLKEYNYAVIHQSSITRMEKPSAQDVAYLNEWAARPSMGFVTLTGIDGDIWETTPISDMIALHARSFDDPLSAWFAGTAVRWYNRVASHLRKKPLADGVLANSVWYSTRSVHRAVSLISMSLASLFPIVSIFALNQMESISKKLGLIILFTVTFSFSLGLCSAARNVDIFAAAAAFAAVQVVFITGNTMTTSA